MVTISSNIVWLSAGLIFLIIAILSIVLINRIDHASSLKQSLIKLKKSFDNLDEQAKIIVKTDLELNRAQEELDKRLNSLDSLQKTSRLISTTLEEGEIYHRLEQSLLMDLNFEKGLVIMLDEKMSYHPKIHLGYTIEETTTIVTKMSKNINLSAALRDGQSFSSISSEETQKETISNIFNVEQFVLSPILTQKGIVGALFVGNNSNAFSLTEGDGEMISILANQLGQSLENARLFSEVYHSSQMLETKVENRTQELAEALKAVQEISKTKSEFISAVSHELRTPLTSIKGYASILIAGKLGDVPDTVKERLEKINLHSDNLVNLINELLDIARIESGRIAMNIGKCNLKFMIENVIDLLTPQMKDKNLNWKVQIDPAIPDISADSSHIERVFINLISNAIKFTPEKGLISVYAQMEDKHIKVSVSDTGIGISPEDLNKLFNEFYRVNNQINANVKGTGLGLALAKKIVHAHAGEMNVTSEVGKGTIFTFTLPLVQNITEQTGQT